MIELGEPQPGSVWVRLSRGDSPQAATLTPDFIERSGVVGPPDRVIAKLEELRARGLDKVLFAAQFNGNAYSTDDGVVSRQLLEAEVIPAIHAG